MKKFALFDMDGTIIDSMEQWLNLTIDFLIAQDIKVDSTLMEELKPLNLEETLVYIKNKYHLNHTIEEMNQALDDLMLDFYVNKAKPKPGALDFIQRLKEEGISMGIITATKDSLSFPALERQGLLPYFDFIQTAENAKAPKASLDFWKRASENAGVSLKDTVVLEDALYAAKIAKDLGSTLIIIEERTALEDQEDLINLADQYVCDLGQIDLKYFEKS